MAVVLAFPTVPARRGLPAMTPRSVVRVVPLAALGQVDSGPLFLIHPTAAVVMEVQAGTGVGMEAAAGMAVVMEVEVGTAVVSPRSVHVSGR